MFVLFFLIVIWGSVLIVKKCYCVYYFFVCYIEIDVIVKMLEIEK